MKKLSLFLVTLVMILVSCKPEIENPTVVTKSVGKVTETTASILGEVISDGGAEVTSRGVCWNTVGNPSVLDNCTQDGTGIGEYTSNLTDLTPNTTYYVKAYAMNSEGISYGEEKTFTTVNVVAPTIVTKDVVNITKNSAESGGNVTSDGGEEVTARGVCWSTKENPTISDSHTTDGDGTGEYVSNITGLEDGTTYYVRAYATNSKGTSYGEEKTFTTVNVVAPTIVTKDVVNITKNSAESGGNVTSDGGEEVTARGVCWSTKENPTISDSHTTDGDGIGEYVSNMTGLEDGTTYYVRAYATNGKGTSYGEQKTFTTVNVVVPTIVTKDVVNITKNSAESGGNVTSDGGEEVTARGVCWSTKENPTISDSHTTDGKGTGEYVSNMTGLKEGTKYYVRAYATNSKGTNYGSEISFRTNGHSYVDLGLSVKWATCNVGANSPEEYGDYFAWGEITPKETYTEDNCPTYELSKAQLKSQGYIDREGNLISKYDAARANWGGEWRMPTLKEMDELVSKCTWTWITQGDTNGYKVTGPNGNSIFLPAAGHRNGSSLESDATYGAYWSSTPDEVDWVIVYYDNVSWYLEFRYEGVGGSNISYRSYGNSVRPVIE